MSINRLRPLKQRGDTIVEVMVVLAVLGLAIGISYATANRSLLATRGAQENSQATELLQGQIEQLRAHGDISDSADPNYIYRTGVNFCFNQTTGILTTTASQCVTSYYRIAIRYVDTVATPDTFTATATWDDVNGHDADTVTLSYRMHQP